MKKFVLLSIIILLILVSFSYSLDMKKYDIYGYSDFIFLYGKQGEQKVGSFLQNRTNLIMGSEFFKRWNFFMNMEFNGAVEIQASDEGNLSTSKTKGKFQLEEAWASYTVSDAFIVKAGIFLAPFGSFNVIQDKSPTYISVRPPMIYDDDFRNRNPVHIIPEKCNLEVSGKLINKKVKLEYYVYAGNGLGTDNSSLDADLSKAFGTRITFNYNEDLKIGFSTHFDNALFSFTPKDNSFGNTEDKPTISYSEKRSLFSIDFDYTLSRFNINGEYFFNHNRPGIFPHFNRIFFYTNLNMMIIEKLRGYVETDYYKDRVAREDVREYLGNGIYKNIVGLNFKPNWRTALKGEVQFYSFKGRFNPSFTVFMTSLSVIF